MTMRGYMKIRGENRDVARPEGRARFASRARIRAASRQEALGKPPSRARLSSLLNWIPAREGDTFFIPAGTIHAIGGGLVLCEVQQHSDLTYRLYDYGRPRELHLDKAMEVLSVDPWTPQPTDCKYFHTELHDIEGSLRLDSGHGDALYVILEGEGQINRELFRPGQAYETREPVEFRSQAARILKTAPPVQR